MEHEVQAVHIPLHGIGPRELEIVQGWHGPDHGRDPSPMRLDYAVDLAARYGALVVAALDGTVAGLWTGSDQCCERRDLTSEEIQRLTRFKANWILINHGRGVQSLYSHMSDGGELVRKGQKVEAQQPIGFTGKTGWVPYPHLHFQLHHWVHPSQRNGMGRNETIPFRFEGYDGPMEHAELFPSPSSSVA